MDLNLDLDRQLELERDHDTRLAHWERMARLREAEQAVGLEDLRQLLALNRGTLDKADLESVGEEMGSIFLGDVNLNAPTDNSPQPVQRQQPSVVNSVLRAALIAGLGAAVPAAGWLGMALASRADPVEIPAWVATLETDGGNVVGGADTTE